MPSSWTSRKTFQEVVMVRRREAENDFRNKWRHNSDYFKRASLDVTKQNEWTSHESYNDSMQAYRKKMEAEEKQEKLLKRRERLKNLLQTERDLHEAEFKGISPENHQRIKEMRAKIEEIRTTREESRKKQAEERLYEHFQKNNPDLRTMQHDYNRKKTVLSWKDQVDEAKAKKEEEMKSKAFEEAEEERKRQIAEKMADRELETKKMMEVEAKEALQRQVKELQEREIQSRKLKDEEDQLLRERLVIANLRQQRAAIEKERQEKEYRQALLRQHKAVLRRRAQDVQKELEVDMKILATIASQEAEEKDVYSARREKVRADVEWMKEVLEDQMALEKERGEELDAMYQEEAAKVWQKREAEWDRERRAREKLMKEVFAVREGQIGEKVAAVRKAREESLKMREEILKDVEIANRLAKEEEEEVELMKQRTKRDITTQRDQQMEKLAQRRAQEKAEEEKDKKQMEDYEEMISREAERFRIDEHQPRRNSNASVSSSSRPSSTRSIPPWATHDEVDMRPPVPNRKKAWT